MTNDPQLQETDAATLTDLDIDLAGQEQHENRWYVVVHNDNVTPFDYVLHILTSLFLLSDELAEHVAQTAHSEGQAVVVVRPRPRQNDSSRLPYLVPVSTAIRSASRSNLSIDVRA